MAFTFIGMQGSDVIAQGLFEHPADAVTQGFFTHWSATSNTIGTVTINVFNDSDTVPLNVQILRFFGAPVVIEVSPNNNRSVTIQDAQVLQVQESAAGIIEGEYLIVRN